MIIKGLCAVHGDARSPFDVLGQRCQYDAMPCYWSKALEPKCAHAVRISARARLTLRGWWHGVRHGMLRGRGVRGADHPSYYTARNNKQTGYFAT